MRFVASLITVLLLLALGREGIHAADSNVLSGTGVVVPWLEIELASKTDGVLQEVSVAEGDVVREGQILARLESRREELEVDSFRLLNEKRQLDWKRFQTLFEQKAGVSEKEVEDKRLEAQLAETNWKLAKERLEEKLLKSPINGMVLRRLKEEGEALQKLEVFSKLVNVEKIYVKVNFEGQYLQRVQKGQTAKVKVLDFPGSVLNGKVEIVDPVVDPASGLFRVKIVLENKDGRIPSGGKAEVEIVPTQ